MVIIIIIITAITIIICVIIIIYAGYTQIASYLSHPGHALAEISFTQTLNKYLCVTKDMGHQAFERGCQYPNNTVMEKGGRHRRSEICSQK